MCVSACRCVYYTLAPSPCVYIYIKYIYACIFGLCIPRQRIGNSTLRDQRDPIVSCVICSPLLSRVKVMLTVHLRLYRPRIDTKLHGHKHTHTHTHTCVGALHRFVYNITRMYSYAVFTLTEMCNFQISLLLFIKFYWFNGTRYIENMN